MNKNTLYIILGFVAIIIIVIVVMARKEKTKSKILMGSGAAPPPPGSSSESVARNDDFPLKEGSYGPNVKSLQIALNKVYDAGISEDSDFGGLTKSAVETHLSNLTGHKQGQITYAEFQYLMKEQEKVGEGLSWLWT